jgi:hypothetical protein
MGKFPDNSSRSSYDQPSVKAANFRSIIMNHRIQRKASTLLFLLPFLFVLITLCIYKVKKVFERLITMTHNKLNFTLSTNATDEF